jgi:hypothetical protein
MKLIGKTQIELDFVEQLKENERLLFSLQKYLDDTDWLVTRFAETGKAVPQEVLEQRIIARDKISELRRWIGE